MATTSPRTRLVVAGGVALVVGLTLYQRVLPDDLVVYRQAGAQLLRDPSLLYAEGTGLPFTYPPVAAVLFLPLALLPGWLGAALVLASSLVALLHCGSILARWLLLGVHAWVAISAAMLVSEPVISTLAYGQLNLVLTALVLTALDRQGPAGGMWLGLAAAVKLTPAVFLAPLLFRGSWRRVAVAAAAGLLATGVGFVVLPAQSVEFWGSTLLHVDRVGGVAYAGNQSLNGLIWRVLGPGGSAGLWWVAVVVVLAIVVVVCASTTSMGVAALAAALGGLLVSPISWTHHWVMAAPVAMLVWRLRVPFWSGLLATGWACALVTWVVWWSTLAAQHGDAAARPSVVLDNAYVCLGAASLVFLLVQTCRDGSPLSDGPTPVSAER
ncbi:MAG: glycosyltransferase 87 family protein [Lapillicoccus sp.]